MVLLYNNKGYISASNTDSSTISCELYDFSSPLFLTSSTKLIYFTLFSIPTYIFTWLTKSWDPIVMLMSIAYHEVEEWLEVVWQRSDIAADSINFLPLKCCSFNKTFTTPLYLRWKTRTCSMINLLTFFLSFRIFSSIWNLVLRATPMLLMDCAHWSCISSRTSFPIRPPRNVHLL